MGKDPSDVSSSRCALDMHSCWLLEASGNLHRALCVFCPREQCTRSIESCRACGSGREPPASARGQCRTRDEKDDFVARLASMYVGEVAQDAVCVSRDVPIAHLDTAPSSDFGVVVDAGLHPIGTLDIKRTVGRATLGTRATAEQAMGPLTTISEAERLASVIVRIAVDHPLRCASRIAVTRS